MFTIKRSDDNPYLSPRKEHPWEAAGAFNWCPVMSGKTTHVVYRALSERELLEEPKIHRSVIGRATSTNGKDFKDRAPFIVPENDYEKYGCEDPRVTKIGGKYYIFYTALSNYPFDSNGIKVALAISKDMKTIEAKHLVTPFNAKAMALFPEKINGKYAAVLTFHTDMPGTNVALALFDKIEDIWSESYWNDWYEHRDSHVIDLHRSNDDQVEVGAVPIKTKEGWLLIYSHANHYFSRNEHSFGVEAVILDKNNPRLIIGRTKGAFLVPELYYEAIGLVPNIVFPSGALIKGKNLEIYYGGADTHSCKATVKLDDLLKSILHSSKPLVSRFVGNPIITPRLNKDWEAHGTFNPAAIDLGGMIHILYRAMSSDETSTFGYATSKDGFVINERSEVPAYIPRADFESKHQQGNSGCEDPRLMEIGKEIFMTYTAYDGHVPRVAITRILKTEFLKKNWDKWSEPIIITPMDVTNKDACIIPEKTAAGYIFLHRINDSICADILSSLDFTKQKVVRCIELIQPRRGMWDGRKVGISGPPIKTPKGWILFYHGISETSTYRVGAVLLDLKDPTTILARTAIPLFEPKEDYEMKGIVPKVVFPCGQVVRKDTIYLYYGGADAVVGVATLSLKTLLKILS